MMIRLSKFHMITFLKSHHIALTISSFIYNMVFSPSVLKYYWNKRVVIKDAFLKHVKIEIDGQARIYIGPKSFMQNCTFIASGSESIIHIEGGSTNVKKSFFIANKNTGRIYVGSGFTSEGCEIKAHEGKSITIGHDCMFSSGINISTTDYHSIIATSSGVRVNKAKDIIMGNHVWLSRNVNVLKGVLIADNIVVGMGSTVSKSLSESYCIYGGTPAHKIKSEVTWSRNLI